MAQIQRAALTRVARLRFGVLIMDIEFHYYMTYLIAARAGFAPSEAVIIAHSAQEVDENDIPITVGVGTAAEYRATVSQTMEILHPRHDEKIYPIFHFIPGNPKAESARRRDGWQSKWVTTPDSDLANDMLDTALRSGNLYRIGASAHAYADTWAHQNFLGIDSDFNDMPLASEGIEEALMNLIPPAKIGHALAGHKPDIPDLIWTDDRLVDSRVANVDRFMAAAAALFRKFCSLKRPGVTADRIESEITSLVSDLKADIGSPATISADPAQRKARYMARALLPVYGETAIPEHDEDKWFNAALVEDRADVVDKLAIFMEKNAGVIGDALDFGTSMKSSWRSSEKYRETDWYKFQEAVKTHLDECWTLLEKQFPELTK